MILEWVTFVVWCLATLEIAAYLYAEWRIVGPARREHTAALREYSYWAMQYRKGLERDIASRDALILALERSRGDGAH